MKSFKKIYYVSVIAVTTVNYFLIFIVITACFGIIEMFITEGVKAFYNAISLLFATIILFTGPFLLMKFLLWIRRDSDLYSVNLKTIKEIIKHKLEEYKKNEWYI